MSEYLQLDAATLKDLEVFESAQTSLFELCNRTRTFGGARVLRKRMAEPYANIEAIRGVQQSLAFILEHRALFKLMPSAYMADRVDQYTHEVLPIVTQRGSLEFTIGTLSLWLNHDRHYTAIALGVQMTVSFMASLRKFVQQPELSDTPGELGKLVEAIRRLLSSPELSQLPDEQIGGWPWQVVRLDQIFRIYEKSAIAQLQTLLHEIDALVAMADVGQEHQFEFPELLAGDVRMTGEQLCHPFVEHAVGNPITLDQQKRVQFLTGPNMAGKTTYLRAIAVSLYFGHLGMAVPAKSFSFVPVDALFTSISLSDDLHGGVSYFRAEALRVKAIAQAIAQGQKVIALMDEPFKGTNVKDALDASGAMLARFATKQDCLFMVSSHLIELSDLLKQQTQFDCQYFEADETAGRLRFDYQLKAGISAQRLGMRVLREEGVFDLLD